MTIMNKPDAAEQAIDILRNRLAGDVFREFAELVDRAGDVFLEAMRTELRQGLAQAA
jgi:hypothetical protein